MTDQAITTTLVLALTFCAGLLFGIVGRRAQSKTEPRDEMDLAVTSVLPRIQALEWRLDRPRRLPEQNDMWLEPIVRMMARDRGLDVSFPTDTFSFMRVILTERSTTASVPSDATTVTPND